jgi:hypothetical protein
MFLQVRVVDLRLGGESLIPLHANSSLSTTVE